MIKKYVFGRPVKTDAVVMELPESKEELSVMELTESDGIRLSLPDGRDGCSLRIGRAGARDE